MQRRSTAKAIQMPLAHDEVQYQGCVVSKARIRTDEDKIKPISNYPFPKNVKLKAIFGLE